MNNTKEVASQTFCLFSCQLKFCGVSFSIAVSAISQLSFPILALYHSLFPSSLSSAMPKFWEIQRVKLILDCDLLIQMS